MKNLILLLFIFLTSCNSVFGTDHGNPFNQGPGDGSGNRITYSTLLTEKFCLRVHACFTTISTVNCQNEMLSNLQIPAELNLQSYSNLSDIKNAELAGQFQISAISYQQCTQSISNNSCSDQVVFDSLLSSGDLSGLHKVFKTSSSCQQIFSPLAP